MELEQDNGHAFFDSADWALYKVKMSQNITKKNCSSFRTIINFCRIIIDFVSSNCLNLQQQGAGVNQNSPVAIETLRPKLQVLNSTAFESSKLKHVY